LNLNKISLHMPDNPFGDLTRSEFRRLNELLSALRTEISVNIDRDSELMSNAFADEFTSRLLSQHVFLGNPLIHDVHSIFQFRYFAQKQRYELVEIPCRLFSGILDVPRSCFSSDGPSINIPVGNETPDFTLKLDRSDAKITIANIRKECCRVHGTWIIENGKCSSA